MRKVNRVQREDHLAFQDRIDVDCGIEVERRTPIAGHVCEKHLADAPLGAQSGAGRHDLV